MAKFIIKCPKCDTINNVKTGLFAKKTINCGHCKELINIEDARMSTKKCPHCGDTFVYDHAKGKLTRCPSCDKQVDAFHTKRSFTLNCPGCACALEVFEDDTYAKCPLCGKDIDVEKEIAKSKLINSAGISVIQYEGDNTAFVWKHPIEDFNSGSQLIVHESQEAIFFMNGQALDLFPSGRYTLETESLPILKNIYKVPTGTQTPFHAEVYFINKTVQMGFKWGTDSRVRFIDPATGIPLDIGASGELNLQVCDSRKLLLKLVGTTGGLTNKQVLSAVNDSTGTVHKSLQSFFRPPLMTEIKSYLATVIKNQNIDIMDIDQEMAAISDAMKERITPKFEEYGLTVANFYITNIALPEDNADFKKLREMRSRAYIGVKQEELNADIAEATQRRRIIEAQTEAQLGAIRAQGKTMEAKSEAEAIMAKGAAEAENIRARGLAEADAMRSKGYTQRDVLAADVQKAYAEGLGRMGSSGGSGAGVMGDMVSAVAGIKVANTMFEKMEFGKLLDDTPTLANDGWICACGHSGNKGKFCEECGAPQPTVWDCPACGHKGNKGKFCEECGAPQATTWDCACGQKNNKGKCCPECGAKRP